MATIYNRPVIILLKFPYEKISGTLRNDSYAPRVDDNSFSNYRYFDIAPGRLFVFAITWIALHGGIRRSGLFNWI